jgi:hypothetical protein
LPTFRKIKGSGNASGRRAIRNSIDLGSETFRVCGKALKLVGQCHETCPPPIAAPLRKRRNIADRVAYGGG